MPRRTDVLAGLVVVVLSALPSVAQPPTEPATTPPQTPREASPQPSDKGQGWKGAIELPGANLEFSVVLRDEPTPSGTMDIPLQGVQGAALSDVAVGEHELKFTLALPGMPPGGEAVFSLEPAADGSTAAGTLRQGGITAKVTMRRLAPGESAGPKRTQVPQPPFPYSQREVTYTNAKDGTRLAGTLTIPDGPGPHPAAVLITGSGAQDRDESLMGHKPFLVIADHLSRHGIAVLRADDRGVGGSTGSVTSATADDSVGDVLAAVALLRNTPTIDGAHIGVIGHSEGGIIGPMAAAASGEVSFVVMLAGTGLPGREILTLQTGAIFRAAGADEALVAPALAAHRKLMDALASGAPRVEIEAAMRDLVTREAEASSTPPLAPGVMEQVVAQQMASLDTPWFRSFLLLDPREALRKVTAPVLAMNGRLDVQVPAGANLPEIRKALEEAGNKDVTILEMPGLNHLFQHARTGGPDEYAKIEETFAPEALEAITEWLTSRTKAAK